MFDEAAAADDGGQEEHCHCVMGWKAMARAAVDRSAGQCEAFCGRADDDVLLYLADRAPSLRSLQVTTHYDVSSNLLSELIKKLPLLEELELVLRSDSTYTTNTTTCRQTYSSNWAELLISTCQSCRHLNRFTVRRVGREPDAESWNYWKRRDLKSSKPSWMPTMHKLRSLVLCGDSFTKCLVLRIVDSCPNLESLDICKVWSINVIWDTEFEDKCSRIKDLHLPYHYYDSDESECYL